MRRRSTGVTGGCLAIAAALTLGACGGGSSPPPVALTSLLPTLAAGYTTFFQVTGHGTRTFTHVSVPLQIQMIMACRGADRAGVTIGSGDLTVACTPGIVGADTDTINRTSTITVHAAPATRWALVVARRI
jgi:hypothetical protein